MRCVILGGAVAAIAGSAVAAPVACPAGLKPAAIAEVFFRQDQIGAAGWRKFVGAEVKPQFPAELIADVYGPVRKADPAKKDMFQREDAKALFVVLTGAPDAARRLDVVRAAYRKRFHENPELLVAQQACAAF